MHALYMYLSFTDRRVALDIEFLAVKAFSLLMPIALLTILS
jgi:hypothetical protein